MEALLLRIDHFHDRALYLSTLKTWLGEIGIARGRLVTMGEFHLLFIEATAAQNAKLVSFFPSRNIDTNAKDEPCTDRFVDVVGQQPIPAPTCKGFLEMNVLNATLLEKLLVSEWGVDKAWLTDALSTPRTKALLKWKEDAKNARRDRRKRAAQDRDTERAAKRARAEQEAAKKAEANGSDEEDATPPPDASPEPVTGPKPQPEVETTKPSTTPLNVTTTNTPAHTPSQQQQKKKKHKPRKPHSGK